MAVADLAALAVLAGIVLAAIVVGLRPLLARLAARNIGRRKSRVLIVVAGLLVGTAIISSSLVVGDTLSYIFLQDVYVRLDAVDELVSNAFNGQLFSFAESNATQLASDLAAVHSPVDGIAPALLKVMPVRNVAGNKGNQQITVMGLNASYEGEVGPLTRLGGRTTDTNELGLTDVFANERAAADLKATPGKDLTLFNGTTNQTIVHASVAAIVRDIGKAAYGRRAILFMDLGRAQAAFNESGAINLIRVSNLGGVAEGVASSDQVTHDLRLSIARNHLVGLQVDPVKADDIALAVQIGRDATDLFLVMGAFGILAGVLLIVNIFVMLAEERKPELGVARAVGFLRGALLATFARVGVCGGHGDGEDPRASRAGHRYRDRRGFPRLGPCGADPRRGLQPHLDPDARRLAQPTDGQRLRGVRHDGRHPRRVGNPDRCVQHQRSAAGAPPAGEPRRGTARPEDGNLLSDGQTVPYGDDRRDVRAHPVHGHADLDAPRSPGVEPRIVRSAAVRRLRRHRVHDDVQRDPELPRISPGQLQRSPLCRRLQRDVERERHAGESRGDWRESVVRLHALGRRQLPDPDESVRVHELPPVVRERVERTTGGAHHPGSSVALPPVQSHLGDRRPHRRGPEPVRPG